MITIQRAIIILFVVCLGGVAGAELFTPKTNYSYTATKAAQTHVTLGKKQIKFKPTAAITYQLNGTGVAYPVAANTAEGPFGISESPPIRSIVFSLTSSAGTTIYVQDE